MAEEGVESALLAVEDPGGAGEALHMDPCHLDHSTLGAERAA